jgi:hypothetical protein
MILRMVYVRVRSLLCRIRIRAMGYRRIALADYLLAGSNVL